MGTAAGRAVGRGADVLRGGSRGAETPEAFEGLSWAAWWLDDAEAVFEAREHAYRLYKGAGSRRRCAYGDVAGLRRT